MNMARDEALAISAGLGSPPALRVYRFAPPAVSIGRFQPVSGFIDLEVCEREKIEVVRRPTGGLAILHLDDFTYSVSLPRHADHARKKEQYFALVARGVLEALHLLGIKARVVSHRGTDTQPSVWCFEGAFGVDIEWQGRKVCGSAQRLFKDSLLQHGSLFLRVHPEILKGIEMVSRQAAEAVPREDTLVSLLEAAGKTITWEDVCLAFFEGFSNALSLTVENGRFSESEESLAGRLYEKKYSTAQWLSRSGS